MPPSVPTVPLRLAIAVCAYVLLVVWLSLRGLERGLERSDCAAPVRRSILVRLGALLATWFIAITAAATAGAWLDPSFPRPVGYILPALVLACVLWRAGWLTAAMDALPLWCIPALQMLRIGGGLTLLGAWATGFAPWAFVGTAGIGDIVVGVTAGLVAMALAAQTGWAVTAARLWNVAGLADMAHTMYRAARTAPGPLQLSFDGPPNLVPALFPLIYLPAFIVPLTILLHLLSLQQLARHAAGVSSSSGARSSSAP
jgi:hypothetical protein